MNMKSSGGKGGNLSSRLRRPGKTVRRNSMRYCMFTKLDPALMEVYLWL